MLHYTWLLYLLSLVSSPTTHHEERKFNTKPFRPKFPEGISTKSDLPKGGKQWALLVSGSSGMDDYRHQADICHAYQVLHSHGIPEERIVVMMVDDLVDHIHNSKQGVIINAPNGTDVYKGVPKDYTGNHVTPENVFRIMQGKNMTGIGSGKTIRSGPNDHIFLYLVAHGAPGFLGFPSRHRFQAQDLKQTIETMHSEKKYAKMVIYVEACYSGSLFHYLLRNNLNVYATTASSPDELSYTCDFDRELNEYVNDMYSISWMEDSEEKDHNVHTLGEQYKEVKITTEPYSHPQEYGDLGMREIVIGEFQGWSGKARTLVGRAGRKCKMNEAVPMSLVKVETLKRKIESAKTPEEKKKYEKELKEVRMHQKLVEHQIQAIVETIANKTGFSPFSAKYPTSHPINFPCYNNLVNHYDDKCMPLHENPYVYTQLHQFASTCEQNVDEEVATNAVEDVCLSAKRRSEWKMYEQY